MGSVPIEERYSDLLFGVRRSVRYHAKREMFFDRLNLWLDVLTLTAGGATAILVAGDNEVGFAAAVTTSALAALSVVLAPDRAARLHNDLARQFIDLERAVVAKETAPTIDDIHDLTGRRLLIEANEPPVIRVLAVVMHNELAKAMGVEKKHMVKVSAVQRWLAYIGISYGADRLDNANG